MIDLELKDEKTGEKYTLKSFEDRVIVDPWEEDKVHRLTSSSKIVIPGTASRQHEGWFGDVRSVGPGALNEKTGRRIPMDLAVGDVVLFRRFAGADIVLDGRRFRAVPRSEIIATIEKE